MSVVQVSTADGKTKKTIYVDSYRTLLDKIEGKFDFKPEEVRVKNEEDRGDVVANIQDLQKLFSKYGTELELEAVNNVENLVVPDSSKRYNMNRRHRGLAIIINNEHFQDGEVRQGSKADVYELSLALAKLQFRISVHRNCTAQEMADIMASYGKQDYSDDDCIVCVFMSHGDYGIVYGVDFNKCPERYLKEPIKRNKSLKGKPKIFFIQACRGTVELNKATRVDGVKRAEEADQADKADLVDEAVADGCQREETDLFIQHSTVPGYVSFRNPERGSWFIQSLASILRERGKKDELYEMALEVNSEVAKKSAGEYAQVSCISSTLQQKVYFPAKKEDKKVKKYEKGFYVGDFLHDMRHGKGTFYFKSGSTYEGDWVNGELTGNGVFIYSDGNQYEGEFYKSKRHGRGKMHHTDGKVEVGDWVDGQLVRNPSPVGAFNGCSNLESGMHLEPSMYMESTNKRYKAVFQTDGNFVLYVFPGWMSILWSTKTAGSSARKLTMEADGNLVLYDKGGKKLWSSGTHGKGPSKAKLKDDGNFVIYDAKGNAMWSTRTGELCKSCSTLKPGQLLTLGGQMMSPNRLYKAVLELDGVFAIYKGRSTVWATNTRDRSARNLVMQRDGNLVIYDKDSESIWSSGTGGKRKSSLTLDDSGHLIIHDLSGEAIWTSKPAPGRHDKDGVAVS